MSRYEDPTSPLEYSQFGKVSDNFENIRRNNPYVRSKYNPTQARLGREKRLAQSRSPIRRTVNYDEANDIIKTRRRVLSPNVSNLNPYTRQNRSPIYPLNHQTDERLNGLRFYGEELPQNKIFANNREIYDKPNIQKRNYTQPQITSNYRGRDPKNPLDEDKRNAAYKQRYQDLDFMARTSQKLQSPNRSLRDSYHSSSRRKRRDSTQVGRPRRASLTMREALENNELKKHDLTNYESPGVSQTLRRSTRNSVRSNDSRIHYPNDPKFEENRFGNFHSSQRRDRFVQEYPVHPNVVGVNRMDMMRKHIEMNEREPTFCGTGDQGCQLI